MAWELPFYCHFPSIEKNKEKRANKKNKQTTNCKFLSLKLCSFISIYFLIWKNYM